VLQGEYTNRISVDHPWLNTRAVVLSLLTLIVVTGLLIIHKRKRPMSPRQSN
jgi:hypothetical protein